MSPRKSQAQESANGAEAAMPLGEPVEATNGATEAAAPVEAFSPPPAPADSSGSLRRLYTVPERMSMEERDRLAQEEFARAIAPVSELLLQAVPEAGSADEAARLLAERQEAYPEDPAAGSLIPGDAYDEDRRVYYRLLHRDYHPNPRPHPRQRSHLLHDRPQLLPGTRGW